MHIRALQCMTHLAPHCGAALPCAQDFFHSVQLNVNNPHFLIMQGRINKVQLCTAAALLLIRQGGHEKPECISPDHAPTAPTGSRA